MAASQSFAGTARSKNADIGFAVGISAILVILFLPMPALLVDLGLAFSISISVLILMVALWIEKPIDFSSFPMVLLIATMLRLALNVATTRLVLTHGHEGPMAAGGVVGGFAQLVMGGDFVIGTVVFIILLTVNFIVITKGATRIAEVGARFTLDAVPGKQMAIDADLSAGLIDDAGARLRRSELEQESSFYGSMDGASKFVRGDAIAGLIITFVNSFGGIIIGVTRHGMSFSEAADVFIKLAVGDGLVTQIPALIVSLAAGLLVSKGSNKGTAEKAILSQFAAHPRAGIVASGLLMLMAILPGLPFFPFFTLGAATAVAVVVITKRRAAETERSVAQQKAEEKTTAAASKTSVRDMLKTSEVELLLGRQLTGVMLSAHSELSHRVAKMRRKFAEQYGFVIPEIRLGDDLQLAPREYCVKIHGTFAARFELRPGELLVINGAKGKPDVPGDDVREPAFGLAATWVPEVFSSDLKALGYGPIDPMSVMLTHLSELIRNNLAQLLSYRDLRTITDGLEPEYRKLLEEITPGLLSFSTLQAILKLLLSERVSIRNLHHVLEAIAEVASQTRKPEIIAEHVRARLAQQICGDIGQDGSLRIIRLGAKWDTTFIQALKRDQKGDVIEFDIEPKVLEAFAADATHHIKPLLEDGQSFAVATSPDARPYVRMIVERIFPNLPVLSHVEVAKAMKIELVGAMS